jgi:3-hydroxy-3-methylglutaryl CoA synthase
MVKFDTISVGTKICLPKLYIGNVEDDIFTESLEDNINDRDRTMTLHNKDINREKKEQVHYEELREAQLLFDANQTPCSSHSHINVN